MNNSKIALDNLREPSNDKVEILEKQRGEWSQITEALNRVNDSDDWQKLKKLVFDGVVEALERQIKFEAERKEINTSKLYHLQGQLAWARRYADLRKLSEFFRLQIENIKDQIKHGKENPRDGAL